MAETVKIEKVIMLAGKLLLMSGAETSRVEDTMYRMAKAFGVENPQCYATPTAIQFSTGITEVNNFLRITTRPTDLYKIAEVNHVSRQVVDGKLDLQAAYQEMKRIERKKPVYLPWVQIVAAALASGCFTIMFQGSWGDFFPAFIAGGLGFSAMLGFDRLIGIRFLAEFLGGALVGVSSFLFIENGFGIELDKIIIGAVMPLVPGLPITNAIRDLVSGHLIAGVAKGVEATLTAFAIGAGVALTFAFV